MDTNTTDVDQKALESFVVENPDLERLESLLQRFNLFEALRAVRVEVRHSAFLAFLLSPSRNHGLGDIFVKRLLQKALTPSPAKHVPITAIDLDTWNLDNLNVLQEWQGIDILLVDEHNHLAVIIENKIDAGEHGEQLRRYWEVTNQHYPNWHIVGLFLTPDGDEPSDDRYIPTDYLSICEILEKLVETRLSILDQDVRVALTHYTQVLRRYIVSESEIAELCRRIYGKHQHALDLIYEYRPDQQAALRELLEQLVAENPELAADHSTKSYIRFALKDWDVPVLHQAIGWTSTRRMLLFEFQNFENKLAIHLIIGPGPMEIRQKLFDMAHSHKPPFRPALRALGQRSNAIYVRQILGKSDYEVVDFEAIASSVRKKWTEFCNHELPQLRNVLRAEKWIWDQ